MGMGGAGFFAGLLGGMSGSLEKYEDRKYLQHKQDRTLRLTMMQDQANTIDQRIQSAIDAGGTPNPQDLAMSSALWKQYDDLTGGGGEGKKNGGMTLGKIGNLLTHIHLAGRMAQTAQGQGTTPPPPAAAPASGADQSGGPAGGLRQNIPAMPGLSSIPGAPDRDERTRAVLRSQPVARRRPGLRPLQPVCLRFLA